MSTYYINMLNKATQDYINTYLKDINYTVNTTTKKKTNYILDDEGCIIAKAILNSKYEVGVIPQGLYGAYYPVESYVTI